MWQISADVAERPSAGSAYANCVTTEAINLVRSNEAAEALVTAAQSRCERQLDAVKEEHRLSLLSDPALVSRAGEHPEEIRRAVNEFGESVHKIVHDHALANVLTVKAKINELER